MGLVGPQRRPHLVLAMALHSLVDTMGSAQFSFAVAPSAWPLWTGLLSGWEPPIMHPWYQAKTHFHLKLHSCLPLSPSSVCFFHALTGFSWRAFLQWITHTPVPFSGSAARESDWIWVVSLTSFYSFQRMMTYVMTIHWETHFIDSHLGPQISSRHFTERTCMYVCVRIYVCICMYVYSVYVFIIFTYLFPCFFHLYYVTIIFLKFYLHKHNCKEMHTILIYECSFFKKKT